MAELGTSGRNPPKFAEAEENVAAIDLISSLPESLLCEILSFLPTKEAVATSILSKRWRSLWTLVPDIDLREDSLGRGTYENPTNFAHIVSSILTQRKTKRVRKFRLSCRGYNCEEFHVKEWVSVAIAGNVEQMDLSVPTYETIDLPRLSISTCQRIVVLKLYGITLDISTAVHFPKLKTLALDSPVNDGILKWVNSACPVLEDFSAFIDFEFPIKIFMASLKKLYLHFLFSVNEIEINTPSLERLILAGSNMPDFSGGELQNVVEANLVWGQNSDDTAVKLLKALDGVQSLILGCNEGVPTDPNLDIPEFSNLIRLKLDLESLDTNFLLNMLQKCHKLEVLVIYKVEFGAEEPNWIEPTSVPICVSSQLTVFEFRGSKGLENELNFMAYILKNASFLQTVTINTANKLNSEAKLHLFKELSKLPRGSDTCELAFD